MANRLAELNRQRRDYAFSGAANIGDVPYLYELAAQQAAANQPAGIGQQGGGMGEGEGAPNPQAFGGGVGGGGSGGASGGADIGLPGPGMTGGGEELDNLYRMWERGGQAGEPGGVGDNYSDSWGGLAGYVDPALAEWTGYLAPGPIGWVGTLGAAGMRASNASTFDSALDRLGLEGLGFFDQVGAAFGGNNYGSGELRDQLAEIDSRVRERRASGGNLDQFDAFNASLEGNLSPSSISSTAAARAQSRVGPLDFSGATTAGSAYGGRGGGSRGADRGGDQGHGGGGDLGGDRNDRAGGPRHQGGPVYGMPGEEVDHTLLAGEYVMSPEAVEAFGPETFANVNMMARMMRKHGARSGAAGDYAATRQKNPPAMGLRGAGVPVTPPEGRVAANRRRFEESQAGGVNGGRR
jgi:hypothetical protein